MIKAKYTFTIFILGLLILLSSSCVTPSSSKTTNNSSQLISDIPKVINDDLHKVEINYYSKPLENYVQNNFFWFYKPPLYESQIKYLIDHYSFFILTKNDELMRDEVMAANESLKIPEYILFNSIYKNDKCTDDPWQNQIAFHKNDYCWIINEHPEWFLRNDEGKVIVKDNSVYIDPLAEGWIDFFTERLHEAQSDFGWEGLFLDNLDASSKRFSSKGVSLKQYPDDTNYVNAVIKFLDELTETYIKPTGIDLYANITYLDFPTEVWRDYLIYLDGYMLEDWAVNWSDGYQSPNEWITKLEMVDKSAKMNKKVFLVSQGNETDLAHQTFAYASYLLIARENVYFRYTDSLAYNEVWHFDIYSKNLGNPICDYYVKDSSFIREFTNGQVIVNPNSEIATITIFEE